MKRKNKLMVEFINHIYDKNYSSARKSLEGVVNENIKGRIKKISTKITN